MRRAESPMASPRWSAGTHWSILTSGPRRPASPARARGPGAAAAGPRNPGRAEAFMLGEAQEHVRDAEVGPQLRVLDASREHDVFDLEGGDELEQAREVALLAAVVAHDQEPASPLDVALEDRERADQILDAL